MHQGPLTGMPSNPSWNLDWKTQEYVGLAGLVAPMAIIRDYQTMDMEEAHPCTCQPRTGDMVLKFIDKLGVNSKTSPEYEYKELWRLPVWSAYTWIGNINKFVIVTIVGYTPQLLYLKSTIVLTSVYLFATLCGVKAPAHNCGIKFMIFHDMELSKT